MHWTWIIISIALALAAVSQAELVDNDSEKAERHSEILQQFREAGIARLRDIIKSKRNEDGGSGEDSPVSEDVDHEDSNDQASRVKEVSQRVIGEMNRLSNNIRDGLRSTDDDDDFSFCKIDGKTYFCPRPGDDDDLTQCCTLNNHVSCCLPAVLNITLIIVLSVVGVLIFITILVLLIYCCCCRRPRERYAAEPKYVFVSGTAAGREESVRLLPEPRAAADTGKGNLQPPPPPAYNSMECGGSSGAEPSAPRPSTSKYQAL